MSSYPGTDTGAQQYAVVWGRVFTGPHRDHGGWWQDQGEPVCACGERLAALEGAAA